MKRLLSSILALAVCGFAQTSPSFDKLTVGTREYTGVTVTAVTPSAIRITHDAGTASINLADLPPELQERFAYDPEKAVLAAKVQVSLQAPKRWADLAAKARAVAESSGKKLDWEEARVAQLRAERAQMIVDQLKQSGASDADIQSCLDAAWEKRIILGMPFPAVSLVWGPPTKAPEIIDRSRELIERMTFREGTLLFRNGRVVLIER